MNESSNVWYTAFSQAITTLLEHIAAILPNVFAAIFMLLVGYGLAKISKIAIQKILEKANINTLSKATGIDEQLQRFGSQFTLSYIISSLIFWIILLVFAISAADTLGLPQLTKTIDTFILFIPKILASLIILLLGLAAANLAKNMVAKAGKSAGLEFAAPLSKIVYGLLIVLIFSVSIGQLDINTVLLDTMVAIALAALGLGVAISLGLGSKSTSENIMYSLYINDLVDIGSQVKLKDGFSGEVIEIGPVATVVSHHKHGRRIIKNADFIDALELVSHPSD
ncbi:MAG: hypothetical protein JXR16_03395 [Bermanella sp.]